MYVGVRLEPVRNAVAAAIERTFQWHFGLVVDVRVRRGLTRFLQRGSDDITNVW